MTVNELTIFIKTFFRFWGWGGEDDDLFYRVNAQKLKIYRANPELGRFQVQCLTIRTAFLVFFLLKY